MSKLSHFALLLFLLLFLPLAPASRPVAAAPSTPPTQEATAPQPTDYGCVTGWRFVTEPYTYPFLSIEAIAPDDVWMSSQYLFQGRRLFHWDGSIWTTFYLDGGGRDGGYFGGFASAASDDVWAVGLDSNYASGSHFALIEHWNGSTWAALDCTNCDTPYGPALEKVAVVSPGVAWAVGNLQNVGTSQVLRCTLASGNCVAETPLPASGQTFHDIAAFGPNNVWVVGGTSDMLAHSLILHWNGAAWSQVSTPNVGELAGISALAANNIWAVGANGILHWNGTAWAIVPSNGGGKDIEAIYANDVWSVGDVTQHWDGTAWTVVSSPGNLVQISAASAHDIWGVTSDYHVMRYRAPVDFTDVPPGSTFYQYTQCASCLSIMSGYPCGNPSEPCDASNSPYFRPSSPVTRGQLAKLVSLSAYYTDTITPTQQSFEDVPPNSVFWQYIERLYGHGVIQGYECGGVASEPCVPPDNRPYYRAGSGASRGQLAKLVSNAAGFNDTISPGYTFSDVPDGSDFHLYVERLRLNRPQAMTGYPCGGLGEPCDSQNRHYFRPSVGVIRGQTVKVISDTFFPSCQSAAPQRK